DRALASAVRTHDSRYPLGFENRVEVLQSNSLAPWIPKSDVLKSDPDFEIRKCNWQGRTGDPRLTLQKLEQIAKVETILVKYANILEQRPGKRQALIECLIEKR